MKKMLEREIASLNSSIENLKEILSDAALSEENSSELQEILSFRPTITIKSKNVLMENLRKLESIAVIYSSYHRKYFRRAKAK